MKTAKELELSLLVKEAHIQQLKLKNQELLSDNMNIAELNINLLNKINKAIDYIEDENIDITTIRFNDIQDVKKDLLEILKGEDNV